MADQHLHQSSHHHAANSSNYHFNDGNNTFTFVVGFGILIVFVLLGLLASVFLCFTLKKDPYLWEAEVENNPKPDEEQRISGKKDRDKFDIMEEEEEAQI